MANRYKAAGQRSVFDELFEQKVRRNRTTILEETGDYLDFELFRPTLERVFVSNQYGPKRFDVVLLLKVVILQKWYNLSDPEAEAQISDRISFRSFLGLSLSDAIPDETTICRFRNELKDSGQYEWLFEVLNEELRKRHVFVKSGSMVDATFIKAPKGKRQDGAKTDPDADHGHKGHGYSMHVNMSRQSKLMADLEMTSARPHDSQHLDDVLIGDETAIWADSAYRSQARQAWLAEQGIESHILEKAQRNAPLSKAKEAANTEKSRTRARVEHAFAQIKTHDGFTQTRYVGLAPNRCDAFLHALAYNLRRGVFLLKRQAQRVVEEMRNQLEPEPRGLCTQSV